jgi:hypothetical protein
VFIPNFLTIPANMCPQKSEFLNALPFELLVIKLGKCVVLPQLKIDIIFQNENQQ